jgi:hypothetical protein
MVFETHKTHKPEPLQRLPQPQTRPLLLLPLPSCGARADAALPHWHNVINLQPAGGMATGT